MKQHNLGSSGLRASEIVMGCMRIDTMNVKNYLQMWTMQWMKS